MIPSSCRERLQRSLLISLVCLLAPCVASAQPAPNSDPLQLLSPRQVGNDFLYVVSTPARMGTYDYLHLIGFAGLTTSMMASLDAPMYRFAHGDGGPPATLVPRHLSSVGRVYDRIGPSNVVLGAAGVLAAGGLLTDNSKHVRTSIRMMEAVLFTQLITGALKETIGRARPFTGDGPTHAELMELEFVNGHAQRSMPSGHTSKIFAAASVVAHQYDSWWVKVPVYATAASAGIQRIESGKHWFSDVVVGAALGYFVGATLTSDGAQPKRKGIAYDPIVSFRSVGLSVRF
jgi:membrane-associated phospholipid phosphatase